MAHSKLTMATHERQLILDCTNSTDFLWTLHQNMQGVRQIYLTGYFVDNPNASRLKIELQSHSFQIEGPIINEQKAGGGVYLAVPIGVAERKELTAPEPLLNEASPLGSNLKLRVKVSGWDNSAVTYTTLILFFTMEYALDKSAPHRRKYTNYDGTF